MAVSILFLSFGLIASPWADDSYRVETIATPEGVVAEMGGIDFLPDGRLVACFHHGEVYLLRPESNEWSLFASGLHDPLGIVALSNREFLVCQRPEVTKLIDHDGDSICDEYRVFCDDFGLSGNYHEFNFGPVQAPDGSFFIGLGTASNGAPTRHEKRGEYRQNGREGRMYSCVPYRGWILKIDPEGNMIPWACGVRTPNGLGFDSQGRLFCTDNQGDWLGTSKLFHIQQNRFYGHPISLTWLPKFEGDPLEMAVAELDQMRTKSVSQFPQGILSNSPTQPLCDTTEGSFGPFAGQLIIGEMNFPRILRVALEDVDGSLQGMVIPLVDGDGLRLGNNRLAFAPDGKSLWTAQTDHGWLGSEGIQRIEYSGTLPFDVHSISAKKSGFIIRFTKPVSSFQENSLTVRRYYYEYHRAYGSNQFDVEIVSVDRVHLADDGLTCDVEIDLLSNRLYEFQFSDVKSRDGKKLRQSLAVYTLNRIPNE